MPVATLPYSEEEKQHKHKLCEPETPRRTPGKEPFPRGSKVYTRPFPTVNAGITNIKFSEHKLLAAPRLGFQRLMLKMFMFLHMCASSEVKRQAS